MKRIQSIAAVALLAAASAYAQTYEPAPRGIPDSFGPPVRELAPPAAVAAPVEPMGPTVTITRPADTTPPPQLVMNVARHQRDADARRCLQNASNKQIHRCAERYRPHGAVTRTKAAKTTAEAAAPAPKSKLAADIGKADLSKAAPPAKPVDTTAKPAAAPPPTTAAVIQKPAATPAPAAPQKAEAKSDRPPKWTDSAKGVMKSRGDHLPE